MARRTRDPKHDAFTREKIQTSQLVNRLTGHALGELKIEMSDSQVRAALGLLKKTLPDLKQTEIIGDGARPLEHHHIVERIESKLSRLAPRDQTAGDI
jgi:hypothetical protein